MAMIAGVIVTSCGGSKSVSGGGSSSNTNKEIEQMEAAIKKKELEMKLQDIEDEADERKRNTKKMVKGEQRTIIFCMDEAFDKAGEYMGGLGVVEARPDRTRAVLDANRAAVADIATRYIGMIKNAVEDYSKDVNVPSGKKMYESSLEGGAAAIGSKVIDKYANVVCRAVSQDATGGWIGYVAVHVMLADAKKGLAEELEVRKVDYDNKKFFEKMDAELKADEEKHKNELENFDQ
jgi:hypothetical protein